MLNRIISLNGNEVVDINRQRSAIHEECRNCLDREKQDDIEMTQRKKRMNEERKETMPSMNEDSPKDRKERWYSCRSYYVAFRPNLWGTVSLIPNKRGGFLSR